MKLLRTLILSYLVLCGVLCAIVLIFDWYPQSWFLMMSATIGIGSVFYFIVIGGLTLVILAMQIIGWLVTGEWNDGEYNPYK